MRGIAITCDKDSVVIVARDPLDHNRFVVVLVARRLSSLYGRFERSNILGEDEQSVGVGRACDQFTGGKSGGFEIEASRGG